MKSNNEIAGKKFHMLTALYKTDEKSPSGATLWAFRCDCGKVKNIVPYPVKKGIIVSCGCKGKHGETKTRLYNIWVDMRMRCKHNGKYWGAKGITVCPEWNEYLTFKKWALENGYAEDKTIDRIDSNGNYSPDNCRWATYKEQADNATKNHKVTMNGETHGVREWCKKLNIVTASTVYKRVGKGMSYEKALTTPNFRERGYYRVEVEE